MVPTLSQHPQPDFSILHISDTHLLGGGNKLHGVIDTESRLDDMFGRIEQSGRDIRALVFTGDLADQADEDAYQRLKNLVEPHARAMGALVIWVMGNHDEREPFSTQLWGSRESSGPLDRLYDVDGLRIIALDTSVPGYHHGDLEAAQLEWLADQLKVPAPRGTVLAMHHPPIPTVIDLMGLIELENQEQLWEAIDGADVRGILAGHLHYSTHTVRAGIPVSVAAAVCYNIDLVAPRGRVLAQVDRGQSSSLVSVYADQLVFSDLPALDMPELAGHSADTVGSIHEMTHEQRREMFSKKSSEFNKRVDRTQAGL